MTCGLDSQNAPAAKQGRKLAKPIGHCIKTGHSSKMPLSHSSKAGKALYPAVFFDRDGTLMHEVHYCGDPGKVSAIPGASEALLRLKERGFRNIIITNQSGIGRGYFTVQQFEDVQAELLRQLGPGRVDATYFCPNLPDVNSPRRKPAPGMVLDAVREHDIDLRRSFFVGDAASDIECGRNAGVRTILVATGYGQRDAHSSPDFKVAHVVEAVDLILALTEKDD
jgi:D-glycero-D-manno-heptose 1,7-bisphosphate phosphatase